MTSRSIALFVAAAIAEIGGAHLMWQAIKDHRGILLAPAGAVALVGYGAIAALQPDAHFGRVLAASARSRLRSVGRRGRAGRPAR